MPAGTTTTEEEVEGRKYNDKDPRRLDHAGAVGHVAHRSLRANGETSTVCGHASQSAEELALASRVGRA